MQLFHASFDSASRQHFNLDQSAAALVISFIAVFGLLANVAVGPISDRIPRRLLLPGCALAIAVVFLLLPLVHSLPLLLTGLFPLVIASSTLRTIVIDQVTSAVGAAQTGSAVSVMHALASFCGVVAPTAGAYIFRSFGFVALMTTSAGLALVAAVFSGRNILLSKGLTGSSSGSGSLGSGAAGSDEKTRSSATTSTVTSTQGSPTRPLKAVTVDREAKGK